MDLIELIKKYGDSRYGDGQPTYYGESSAESEKLLGKITAELVTLRATTKKLCNEAQAYVDIGWDCAAGGTSDESAELVAAIATVRNYLTS